jgi:hypothetical protein
MGNVCRRIAEYRTAMMSTAISRRIERHRNAAACGSDSLRDCLVKPQPGPSTMNGLFLGFIEASTTNTMLAPLAARSVACHIAEDPS